MIMMMITMLMMMLLTMMMIKMMITLMLLMMIMMMIDYTDGDDDVYSKLKIYYIGMESDFFNCLRIDDLLTPLSKKKRGTANKLKKKNELN